MSSDFPLSVRSGFFSSFFLSQQGERGCVFAVFFDPVPEEGVLDFIAHGFRYMVGKASREGPRPGLLNI